MFAPNSCKGMREFGLSAKSERATARAILLLMLQSPSKCGAVNLGVRGRSLTEQGLIQRKLLGLGRVSRAYCGYHLATISGKILVVKCASFDGKTALPDWNSLKNQRIALCLSAVRRIPLSPPCQVNSSSVIAKSIALNDLRASSCLANVSLFSVFPPVRRIFRAKFELNGVLD